jgi:hypothetical protein
VVVHVFADVMPLPLGAVAWQQAFTHSTFAHAREVDTTHNERLEFLGDGVLEFLAVTRVFLRHPTVHTISNFYSIHAPHALGVQDATRKRPRANHTHTHTHTHTHRLL